ncbi:MAG: metallopeptidase family protein [Planctomycetia bacterium]|nr:metallopeptidase family protein [Planctomycetia bacterium]
MSMRKFCQVVGRVLDTLPAPLRRFLDNVVVDVEEEPDLQTLRDMDFTEEEIAAGETIYGLFSPLPLPDPVGMDFDDPPHRIIIYKWPLEDDFPDRKELLMEIRKTVMHELAHHFGYTDDDLEKFDDNPDPFGDNLQLDE